MAKVIPLRKTTAYDTIKERAREYSAIESRKGRDIGEIPPIENIQRRESCREDPELFCLTYNPKTFYRPFCQDHRDAIARLKEAAIHGALYAFAMARGTGKTTLCRMIALWAIAYCYRQYCFIIGANDGKAQDNLSAIKMYIRFLPLFKADFPEISYPAQHLAGIAQKAGGQLCLGEPTMIEWSKDRICLATVAPPSNWPAKWLLRHDGMVPTSGSVIGSSGLTGDGIRGSLITLSTGESLRPDFVLLDDPQTRESANSPSQIVTRTQLISADILGMAGPGKTISAVMPCTVISPDDVADQILDRKKNPVWRGERRKMLISMPANMPAWEKYFEVYADCAQREPPDYADANEYYAAHRIELDAGAEASWPERKLDREVSAIQHAMHIYYRDPFAFASEYQNEPLPKLKIFDELTADRITKKINNRPRFEVPLRCSRLTAFIDVQQSILFYAVVAWEENFTGYVVDYGTYPDQQRSYFTLSNVKTTLQRVSPEAGAEGSIRAGLESLTDLICEREWIREDDTIMPIDRCFVDAGYATEVVKRFCREAKHSQIITPTHGLGIRAAETPISNYRSKPGERYGLNWYMPVTSRGMVRHLSFDANWWKSFVHARLSVALGDKGCLSLFGTKSEQHRLLADHIKAEYRIKTEGRGRTVDEWKLRPERPDNHWFDCLVGCSVAASMQGVTLDRMDTGQPDRERRRVSFAQMQANARKMA